MDSPNRELEEGEANSDNEIQEEGEANSEDNQYSDEEIKQSSRKTIDYSDDESEDEDEEMNEEDLKFIADDDEEDSQDEDAFERRKRKRREKKERKRKRIEEEGDEQLSEDELELINENISGKSGRQKLRKKAEDRDDVAKLFDEDEEQPKQQEYDSDGLDDFIEDEGSDEEYDKREKVRERKIHKQLFTLGQEAGISNSALEEIEDLFGDGSDYAYALNLGTSQLAIDDDYENDVELPVKQKEVTIRDVYEPTEIAEKMLTEKDESIRIRDIPERFQGQDGSYVPDDAEIAREAGQISKILQREHKNVDEKSLSTSVTQVLRFLRRNKFDVPFIYTHRKDYFNGVLELPDIWKIVDLDEKFIQVEKRKTLLLQQIAQIATLDPSITNDEQIASLVEKIVTMDDVNDTFAYIQLLYSAQLNEIQKEKKKRFKPPTWKQLYDDSVKYKINEFTKLFNINKADFVTSVATQSGIHFPEDHFDTPLEAAAKFISPRFPSAESVLEAAKHMLAQEIATHPQLRAVIRIIYSTDAVVTVHPTDKGYKEIESTSPYYPFKYLKEKPVPKFVDGQFLQIIKAEQDGLLTLSIHVDEEESLVADIVKFICNDYSNELAQLWNAERKAIAVYAAKEILFPQTVKWLKEKMGNQACDYIAMKTQISLERHIGVAPYRTRPEDEEAPVTMAISWGDGGKSSTFAVVLNETGELREYKKFDKLSDRDRHADIKALVDFIDTYNPAVIAISGFKPNTKIHLFPIIQTEVLNNLPSQKYLPRVLIVEDECARIYMNSKSCLREFPDQDYPHLVRYCVSLARYVQDPINEYAALYNSDEDIRNIILDPLQHLLLDDIHMKAIERAFINVVNDCGVDINLAANHTHLSNTLQFASGLGPRKAQAMISKIVRSGGILESRGDLIQLGICQKVIFDNCSSFIRIRQYHLRTGNFDILDDTRIHPKDYKLARKMAADALDLDDSVLDDEHAPSQHVQELIEGDSDRLNLLLLDDYADELERRNHEPKRVCLNLIKDELMYPYKDHRRPFSGANDEAIFNMLTGESDVTLYEGAVISAVVTRVEPRFINVQLGSGIEGTVHMSNVDVPYGSDVDLTRMFHVNQALMCSVKNINLERLGVDLSIRSADLDANSNKSRVRVDPFFDFVSQEKQIIKEKQNARKVVREKQVRFVQHPFWQATDYKGAQAYLANRPRGDLVVRPSGKGNNHISITWKVDEGVYQHIDILESQKENEWSLGKRLTIDDMQFFEIDQIIAEYIEPMTRKISMLIDHPKYQNKTLSEMYTFVGEQVHQLKRSAYGFIISPDKPGSFLLVFRHPSNSPRQDIITVRPGCYEFRNKKFTDVEQLLMHFKQSEAAKATQANTQAQKSHSERRPDSRNDPRQQRRPDRSDRDKSDNRRPPERPRDSRGPPRSGYQQNGYSGRNF
ncbi:Transcription elongation factor spt6 [Terramyces sp. JEL0728]|nr:Transcription elongation factor spt6 [Terramyces sp. JEL0728]